MRPHALLLAGLLAAGAAGGAVAGEADAPAISWRIQDTTDFWRNTTGGKAVGNAILEKLDLQADWSGASAGHGGWTARARVIATNADFFSARYAGDLQTLSNIEGDGYLHAFELWGQKAWGEAGSLRAGFLDLNADFDAVGTAALMLNSSHGIGPDLSQSGLAGPSIFPITGLGVRGQWTPDKAWTLSLGAYDGLPGRDGGRGGFASTDLSRGQGATLIGEADRKFGDLRLGLGGWAYTARYAVTGDPTTSRKGQAGAYGFVEAPLAGLKGLNGWVRLGRADADVDLIDSYAGAGVTAGGDFLGRPNDRLGLAVARAGISPRARAALGLRGAETSIEATYRTLVVRGLALQPDVQYLFDPGGRYRNALAVGLRVVLTAKGPDKAAPEPDDATAPDTPS